jgi:hypothetical protein
MPEDIPSVRHLNALMAFCLMAVSLICWLPIFGTLYYDGFGKVLSWPSLFYWFLAIGTALVGLGIHLLVSRRRIGAEVRFDPTGFTIEVRNFFRRGFVRRLDWRDIEEVTLVEAPRGGDVLAFRLTHEAAVRERLIQPTTRADASKALVRREIGFPLRLAAVSIAEAVSRFRSSAEGAGATLVEQSSFNIVVFVRKVWRVMWP